VWRLLWFGTVFYLSRRTKQMATNGSAQQQLLAAAWQSWPQMTLEEAARVAGLGDVQFVRWFAGKPQDYHAPEEFAACSHPSSATPDQLGAVNLYTKSSVSDIP
jgi:hypothetical protein